MTVFEKAKKSLREYILANKTKVKQDLDRMRIASGSENLVKYLKFDMGVDYSSITGIGIQIDESDFKGENLERIEQDGFVEFLEDDFLPDFIEYSEAGSVSYGGTDRWYLFIKDPFKDNNVNFDSIELLQIKVAKFKEWLKEKELPYENIQLVDDLHIH